MVSETVRAGPTSIVRKPIQLLLTLAAIMALAAGFRLAYIGSLPRGLHPDEAVEGLDALRVLSGERPIYFPDNNGREPLFAYLAAVSISFLGRTPGAIRLVNAIAGILTIPGLYLTACALFNRRIGLLSAFIGATIFWPIMLDRLGTRPPLLPCVLSFSLWQGIRGWQTGRWWNWLLSGVLWGVAFYTHLPIRIMPLALILFTGYLLFIKQAGRLWPGALLFVVGCGGCVVPLAIYGVNNFEAVFGRTTQVSIIDWNAGLREAASRLIWQTYVSLQMFVWRGDSNPRQNIPKRPIFDAAMALPLVLSLALSFRRHPHGYSCSYPHRILFCAIWVGVGLLPTILSDSPPHFSRISAIMPVLFIWPAIGINWCQAQLRQRRHRLLSLLVPAAFLSMSTFFTARDYLLRNYLASPQSVAYFFAAPTDVALEINRYLGIGWQGHSLAASPTDVATSRVVWVDARLWGPNASQAFLTPLPAGPASVLRLLTPDSQPFEEASEQMKLIVLPDEAEEWANRAPSAYAVSVYDGPLIPLTKLGPTTLPYRVLIVERK
jgi:uncharacterized membrane protein (GlpM family)